jgi:hypothetical protein
MKPKRHSGSSDTVFEAAPYSLNFKTKTCCTCDLLRAVGWGHVSGLEMGENSPMVVLKATTKLPGGGGSQGIDMI